GYDTLLGENGASLSGGEGRRLMLARAAIRDARVLLLDEPLAGLDPEARPVVAEAIRRIAAGRTTIVISHGYVDELDPDVVLHIQDGRLAGHDVPAGARPGGPLARRLPDLPTLLDGDSAADLFRRAGVDVSAATPVYLRAKPPDAALIGYHLEGESGTRPGYVRAESGDGRAAEIMGKWLVRRPAETQLGPGVAALPGGRSILFSFPNDHKMKRLRDVADGERLGRLVSSVPGLLPDASRLGLDAVHLELLRYKPERRLVAVLRRSLTGHAGDAEADWVIRYFATPSAGGLAAVSNRLRRAGVPVAAVLGVGGRDHLRVEETVSGTTLREQVEEGKADPEALADALLRLHGCGVDLPSRRSFDDVRATARRGLAVL